MGKRDCAVDHIEALLAADSQSSVGSLILIADGLGMDADQLLKKAMGHLSRIQTAAISTADQAAVNARA